MGSPQQCPKCGRVLPEAGVAACPLCGLKLARRPLSHPAWFGVLTLGVVLCCIAFFATLLFGFVSFSNPYTSWQRYQGAPYHRAEFQVAHTYYHRHGQGLDVSASGTVEGQPEWMDLLPYVKPAPRGQIELNERVPVGTSIPIYLFPDMKGQARIRLLDAVPPAEAYHRAAMSSLKHSLTGLALTAGILFVLLRLRALCFKQTETTFSASV